MVPNTSDDLPDPETPVNTVSRRLGISTLTSFRLFTRAPCTRIRSWLSAGCWLEEPMSVLSLQPHRLEVGPAGTRFDANHQGHLELEGVAHGLRGRPGDRLQLRLGHLEQHL